MHSVVGDLALCTGLHNLGNFMRTLAIPKEAEAWSLTSRRDKLIKTSSKVVSHGRYVMCQTCGIAADVQGYPNSDRLRASPALRNFSIAAVWCQAFHH